MPNPDFNLAEMLKTMRDLDRLDEPVIRVDDPPPGQDVPLEPEPLEDDPVIRIDDPVDPQPAEDIPIEPEPQWYPCDEAEEPVAETPAEPEPIEEEYDPAVTCY